MLWLRILGKPLPKSQFHLLLLQLHCSHSEMTYTTRGIVLHYIKYSETSVIVRIYTELFGLQSYIINGVRNNKAKIKINALQPLSLLEMVVHHRSKNGLQRIREASNSPFISIPYNSIKCSLALFLTELLYKSIREEEANAGLFGFLFHSIQILDITTDNCANFHLLFMIKLSKFLGFYPNGKYSKSTSFFDLREGVFDKKQPEHPDYMPPSLCIYLNQLFHYSYNDLNKIKIPSEHRKELLHSLIEYYVLHLSGMKSIKSHKVLETVMS